MDGLSQLLNSYSESDSACNIYSPVVTHRRGKNVRIEESDSEDQSSFVAEVFEQPAVEVSNTQEILDGNLAAVPSITQTDLTEENSLGDSHKLVDLTDLTDDDEILMMTPPAPAHNSKKILMSQKKPSQMTSATEAEPSLNLQSTLVERFDLPMPVNKLPSIPTPTSFAQLSREPNFYQMRYEKDKIVLTAKIEEKKKELLQVQRAIGTIELNKLPDGGKSLNRRQYILDTELKSMITTLTALKPPTESAIQPDLFLKPDLKKLPSLAWRDLRVTTDIQHGVGDKAMENFLAEKSVTLDALKELHNSLKSCPPKDKLSDYPSFLKSNVKLMNHQKYALTWMTWRETQKPSRGGILADDMGLGKTLSIISLVLKSMESNAEDSDDGSCDEQESSSKRSLKGGTLIVCPASLLGQWENEVKARVKSNVMKVLVYHGPSREKRAYRLARMDLVISTYAIVRCELGKQGPLHQVKWNRIVLDEAHVVRNHQSKTSIAVVELSTKFRWVLTGTPVHNKELDLYALLKFLRCSPFDELSVWRRWVDNKQDNGMQRLNIILQSILLRRTKEQLQEQNLLELPEKTFHQIDVKLSEAELMVYEKVAEYSRNLFHQFLNQRAEKEWVFSGKKGEYTPLNLKNMNSGDANPYDQRSKLGEMVNKYKDLQDVKTHEILVLLLRLRQICCHPGLITAMLSEGELLDGGENENDDLTKHMEKLMLAESKPSEQNKLDNLDLEGNDVLNVNNPIFDTDRASSKIEAIFRVLEDRVFNSEDKAVVVSQWSSMLEIMLRKLKERRIKVAILTGSVAVKDRGVIVDSFNKENGGAKILLLSLTAGGVGLNLVGGNNLLLCDLHWNPQLEAQACDRIYRVGQKKAVNIFKFICEGTIEQTIKTLQEKKMALAVGLMTGARQDKATKLTIEDMKFLFNVH